MKYDFDKIIDRKETHSVKWDKHLLEEFFGTADVLPLWVADMDFQCPQPMIDALKRKAAEGISCAMVSLRSKSAFALSTPIPTRSTKLITKNERRTGMIIFGLSFLLFILHVF